MLLTLDLPEVISMLKQRGFSDLWIARKANLSECTIQKIRQRRVKDPGVSTYNKIVSVYQKYHPGTQH